MTLLEYNIITSMEFVIWMLLICKTLDVDFKTYKKEILMYFPVYLFLVGIVLYLVADTSATMLVMVLSYISVLFFIKIAFYKKFTTSMFICIYTVVLMTFFQFMFTGLLDTYLGAFRSSSVEFIFSHGVIILGLTLASAAWCYLSVPLNYVMKAVQDINKFKVFDILLVVIFTLAIYFLTASNYYDIQALLINNFLTAGIAFLISVAGYHTVKFVSKQYAKYMALKEFMKFKKQPVPTELGYESHLRIPHLLALINDVNNEHSLWYIKNCLDSFRDRDGDLVNDDFWDIGNSVLAIYFFVKLKYLQDIGYKCTFDNCYSKKVSGVNIYQLIQALEIMSQQVLTSAEKADCEYVIMLRDCQGSTNPLIAIANINDFVKKSDIERMMKEDYSLVSGKPDGLRQLKKIAAENNLHFDIWIDEEYLNLSLSPNV